VSPPNQHQATGGCVWVDEDDKSRSRWHWKLHAMLCTACRA